MADRRGIVAGLVALTMFTTSAWAQGTPDLVGVWAAERRFGPEAQGPLVVRMEHEAGYWAEIGGHRVRANLRDGELRFEIPGDRGRFRGRFAADRRTLVGHWVQPWNFSSFSPLASPVTLERREAGVWSGTVSPLEDRLRFFLVIQRAEDGRLTGFLRNPEANLGRFYPIDRVVIEGSNVRFLDASGRARLGGEYHEDFGRLSLYFPLNGGTYDFVRAEADSGTTFLPRPPGEPPYRYRRPIAGEGWQTASPEEVGMRVGPLEELIRKIVATPMDAIDAPYIHAILVARHGKLILEEYFHGYSRHVPHGTRSASKSITSTLVGIAQHRGVLDLDTPVYETIYAGTPPTGLDPRARRMTLRHLITMSSGLACNDGDEDSPGNEDRMQNQDAQPDWVRFTLDLPMEHEPGEHAAYCSGGMNLAGAVLSRRSGEWLPDFYRRHFAEPLAAGLYHFNLTPTGEGYAGGGLFLKPRDFLKLGQLYLNDGVWDGRRLLPRGWARQALAARDTIGREGYGYGWWSLTYPFGEVTVQAYYAGGNGGQYVILVPALDLIVAGFGGNYNQRVMHVPKYVYVRDYVLRAVARPSSGAKN